MPPNAAVPTLDTVAIQGVDLLFPGTFTGVAGGTNTYTSDHLDSAVQAFQELHSIFTPKAKLGHSRTQALLQADGYPSAGDITNVYRRGDRLVVDVDKVPAKLAALIKAGGYGPRSAELLIGPEFNGKKYPLVLKGFAWLGEDPPAVAGLDDVLALYAMSAAEEVALAAAGGESVTVTLAAPTKTEGGKSFPKSDYAYTPSDTPSDWKLRLTSTPGGAPDPAIVGAAAAALGPGYRGQKVEIPDADRAAVIARVRAAWKKANPDKKDDEMPEALRGTSAAHSRGFRAFLSRFVGLAADAGDMTDADLAQQAIDILNRLVVREAQEQVDGEDEDDDIRSLLMARDILQQFAQGELMESIGVDADDAGQFAAYSAPADGNAADDGKPLKVALDTVKQHLDTVGKGKKGVGMARVAHKMLDGYVKAMFPPATAQVDRPPPGLGPGDGQSGSSVLNSRPDEEGQVNETELRTLLGIDPDADLHAAILSLKGQDVALSAKVAELERSYQEREAKFARREAELTVEKAIDAHKLAPAQREWAIGRAIADPADFEVFLSAQPQVWASGTTGSAGTVEANGPTPPTPKAVELAKEFGVTVSDLTPTETWEQRLQKAREDAIAGTANGRRG